MSNQRPDIQHLFEPRGVAVIGASTTPTKIGYKICDNIVASGYQGELYPINPKGGEILGRTVYTSIDQVPGPVDLATIVIPASCVFPAVEACAAKGVRFLSIITSGFSEVGKIEEERRIVEYAHAHGMRVMGPNIFGIYSARAAMNATFGPKEIDPGGVAIITQSGALGIAMIGKTKTENIGLSAIVSIGNKSDIDEADLLEYLVEDDATKVILMYVEGVKDGDRLLEVLTRVTRRKPVVVLKSGRSKRGAMAAASHTGSLAGADEVFCDVIRQSGVLRAESIQEALDWCKFLGTAPRPKGESCVIVTNGGGIGVIAADACEKYGVPLYDDVETLHAIFDGVMPAFGSAKNPVDITGTASLEDYERSLMAAIDTDDIHSVICLGCETAMMSEEALTGTVKRIAAHAQGVKPIVFSFFGGEEIERSIVSLRKSGIPMFGDVYEAVSCLGALYSTSATQGKPPAEVDLVERDDAGVDVAAINALVDKVLADNRTFLLAHEAAELASLAGLTAPKTTVARSMGAAVAAAKEIGFPVVMKIVSKDIIHKSDAGGVALDLQDEREVVDAFEAIMHSARAYKPDAVIQGVEVCEMVKKDVETIVGARRDPSFGPVVMFGLGGIYVEVMKDVSFRSMPLDRREVMSMVKATKAYPLLLGVRGEDPKDIETVIDHVVKVGVVLERCPRISDIEINPLVAYDEGHGVRAVDIRVLLSRA